MCHLCFMINFFTILLIPSYTFKLNAYRIILPSNFDSPSNFSLKAYDAKEECFYWKSTAPHLVQISPIFVKGEDVCSKEAIVSAIAMTGERQVSHILVKPKDPDSSLVTCEVIIDVIASIHLVYRTSEIQLGGPLEAMVVFAKNKEGYIFNSLSGVQFEWSAKNLFLKNVNEELKSVVRLIKYSDSLVNQPLAALIEKTGNSDHSAIMIDGQNTGSAVIRVNLKHDLYSDVSSAETIINVVQGDTLKKNQSSHTVQDFYLLPGAKMNLLNKASLFQPIGHYHFKVLNTSVAKLIDEHWVIGLQLGNAVVTAESIYDNVIINIHVVKPDHIELTVPLKQNWGLLHMKTYEIFVNLYDSDNNLLQPSDNVYVQVTFPHRLFYINASNVNGMHHIVQTIVPGSGTMKAEYKGVMEDGLLSKEFDVVTFQKVTIYQAVQITPPFVFLPLYNDIATIYDIKFEAVGGTSSFKWEINDMSGAVIKHEDERSCSIVVNVTDEKAFMVKAVDRKYPEFYSVAKVLIKPIVEIEAYSSVVEAEIGNDILIPVALLGFENKEKMVHQLFDDCSKINLKIEVVEKHVVSYKNDSDIPPFGRGCITLQFLCKLPGHSRIYIQHSLGNSYSFKTTLIVACHKTLKAIHPVRIAVLALGTSKQVAFEGGPRPWPIFPAGHYVDMFADESRVVDLSIIKDPYRYNKDLHIYKVTCKELGETVLRFSIGNKPSATNKNPAKIESSVKIICGKPATLHIAQKINKKKNVPNLHKNIVKVPIYGEKLFEINVWVKDILGRKFANISSLVINWDVSNYQIVKPVDYRNFLTETDGSAGYTKISRNFQKFEMTGDVGTVKITARLKGYRADILKQENIQKYDNFTEIVHELELQLVSVRDFYNTESTDKILNQENQDTCENDSCKS